MTAKSRRLRALLALLATVLVATTWLAAAPTARADDATKVLLLLDVSGSMNEPISSGGTKFTAAKQALKQVADALPAGTQVGLRVYGSEIATPKEREPKACTDTRLVLPIGPLDRSRMYGAVDSFKAVGETPIAYSLGKAVDDLGDSGKRVLVLISDGEESCAGDPCPTARKLADTGVELQFNAVGLDVGGKARKQLKCIAQAGNGTYYDADESGDLSDALRKLTQRALRPFAISGRPVTGSEDSELAPEVVPGQYRDVYPNDEAPRYYRIARTPGQTVTASVTSLVPPTELRNQELWNLALSTPGGEKCDESSFSVGTWDATTPISGAVVSGTTGSCRTEPLMLSVKRISRNGNDAPAPAEILVSTEPEITNTAELPAAVKTYQQTGRAVASNARAKSVAGGAAFTDAPLIGPGSYTDAPAAGETVFYRVKLATGQRLRATIKAPLARSGFRLPSTRAITVATQIYSPSRVPMTRQFNILSGGARRTITAASPEVRVRNRELAHDRFQDRNSKGLSNAFYAARAGEYVIAVEVLNSTAGTTGIVVPIGLAIAVDGQPAGEPQYATPPEPTPTPASPTPAPPTSGASSTPSAAPAGNTGGPIGGAALWVAGGLGAAAAAAVAVGVVRLTRRGSPAPAPDRGP